MLPPSLASEMNESSPATPQQLSSIHMLCRHLRKPLPGDLDTLTFFEARKLIKELTTEYKEAQQKRRETPTDLVPGAVVRIQARGNCYCEQLPHADDHNTVCDYCKYNGKMGTLVKIDLHNDDGDFFGVQFPESKTIYFWRTELEVLGTFNTIFSIQRYHHSDQYSTWAIAVNGQIAMDVWENGSSCPFFWGKLEDLQPMIDRKDSQLLKLLTPSGLTELHKARYDRIMAQS
jgi:hypothetical protein